MAPVTSFALGAGEAVGTHTSVGAHAASSVETTVFTDRWRRKERKTSNDTTTRTRRDSRDIFGFQTLGLIGRRFYWLC